ncbi:hypothetical protein AN8503.2 [Aspergillus nidulans FGSC A4]|nr:hypothetical protein AN8503.2 [Aspergillus nidulans FGSC A4]|eukprot:XP_681772.1 hypothetical protein AN8503.2 [Aspergillus nidulans FGSC A4]
MALNATRPTLQRSVSSSSALQQHHRPFSIAVPARPSPPTPHASVPARNAGLVATICDVIRPDTPCLQEGPI